MYQQEMLYSQSVGEMYRALRKHSFRVGLCLIAGFIIQEISAVFLHLFGFGKILESNLSFQYAVSILFFTVIAMLMPFLFYSLRKGRLSYIKALPFHSAVPSGKMFLLVAMGFGLCIASNGIAGIVSTFFSYIGIEGELPEPPVSQNALDVFMNFVAAAVVAPLIEEFIFRGVIMQPLRRYGDRFAVVASAAVFGLAHVRPTNIVFAFLSGIIIGCAVVYSRSIWVGIIIHMLNNAFSTLFTELGSVLPEITDTVYLFSYIAVAAAGIVAFVIYGIKYGMRMKRDTSGLSFRRKFVGFFFSLPMILTLIYYLTNVIRNIA